MDDCFDPRNAFLGRQALRRFRDPADADDAAQEVRLRAIEQRPGSIEDPRAWSAAVTLRLAIDAGRRKQVAWRHVDASIDDEAQMRVAPSTEALIIDRLHLREALLQLSSTLGPEEAGIVMLREYFELAYAAIAASTDREADACRQIHHRALERLRKQCAEDDGLDWRARRSARAMDPASAALVHAILCRAVALASPQPLSGLFGRPVSVAAAPSLPAFEKPSSPARTQCRTAFIGGSPVLLLEFEGCLLCALPIGALPIGDEFESALPEPEMA